MYGFVATIVLLTDKEDNDFGRTAFLKLICWFPEVMKGEVKTSRHYCLALGRSSNFNFSGLFSPTIVFFPYPKTIRVFES